MITGIIITAAVLAVIVIALWLPMPIIAVARRGFANPVYSMPDDFEKFSDNVSVYPDIKYSDDFPNSELDLILCKDIKDKLPVIFWMHGGGYIAGDKKDHSHYMTMLAAHGFAVVNFNYGLAPRVKYPVQLHQIATVYNYICSNASEYNLDMSRVFFAGDSAGAHMSAQFVNIQTNPEYAKAIGIKSVVPKVSIRGILLFCGFYDFKWYVENKKGIKKYIFSRIAWSYFGKIKWKPKSTLTILKNYLSESFPPCFLTDGNKGSFENQARDLERALKAKKIPVVSVFYDTETVLGHEYQFHLNEPNAQETLTRLLGFLNEHK